MTLLKKSRGLLLPLLLTLAWEYASRQDAAGAYAFVPLSAIGSALLEMLGNGELLVNLLASSSALAGWATVFIVGAFRGLTGLLRRGPPTSRRWQSATPAAIPVPAPFDAGRSASLPPSR